MIEFLLAVSQGILRMYELSVSVMPENLKIVPPLLIFSFLLAGYGIFTWFFYRLMARRDIFSLKLDQYNSFGEPALAKTFAVLLYILEFLIVLPFIVLLWFSVFSIVILLLSGGKDIGTVLFMTASLVAAVRITAYFQEDLSRDMAKTFPFALLAIALSQPEFFAIERVMGQLLEIPQLFLQIIAYSVFIMAIEMFLRISSLVHELITSQHEIESKET